MVTTNQSRLFEFFLTQVQSETTLQTVWKNLANKNIIGTTGHLGSTSLVKKLSEAVSGSSKQSQMPSVYSAVSIELADIYAEKKRNVNRIFTLSIVAIGIGILLLLAGLGISFWQRDADQVGIITTASGIITTFVSATFFWLYKKENAKLTIIENDIRKIKVLEGFAAIASNMKDEATVLSAYQKIVSQMEIAS